MEGTVLTGLFLVVPVGIKLILCQGRRTQDALWFYLRWRFQVRMMAYPSRVDGQDVRAGGRFVDPRNRVPLSLGAMEL